MRVRVLLLSLVLPLAGCSLLGPQPPEDTPVEVAEPEPEPVAEPPPPEPEPAPEPPPPPPESPPPTSYEPPVAVVLSSRATAYFLTAIGGLYWSEEHEKHCGTLDYAAGTLRRIRQQTGTDRRLQEIHDQLVQLVQTGTDTSAFADVARHVLNVIAKLEGLTQPQRELFCERIAPALQIDADVVEVYDPQPD